MINDKIRLYNETFANFMGWEISTKAKRLKKRKLFTEEIGNGYLKIHPDDIFFDKSWELLNRVINKLISKGVNITINNNETKIYYRCYTKQGTLILDFSYDGNNRHVNTYKALYNTIKSTYAIPK